MNNTLQHYANLRAKDAFILRVNGRTEHLLPNLTQAGLVVGKPAHTEDHAMLWQNISAFQPSEGWLCFQSAVKPFSAGQLPEPDGESGWLLNGEMVNAQGQSLHIQQYPEGGWVMTQFSEQAGGDYLVQPFAFLSTDEKTLGKLQYRVYWEYDREHGYQRRFSRFTGFVQEGN